MHDGELSVWQKIMGDGTKCLGEEQYLQAEEFFSQGLHMSYQLNVPEIIAFSLRLLATVRLHLNNLEHAEEGFREALRICQEIRNAKGIAEARAGLANLLFKQGNLDEAGKQYELAIKVYPQSSPVLRLGMIYADLGQVYTALENWNEAHNAYIEAHRICSSGGFSKGEAELDVLLGELCLCQGNRKEALNYLKQAGQIYAGLEDALALANTLQYLALIHFEDDALQLAFECQQKAVALYLKLEPHNILSESCYFLSIIEQLLENFEEAKYYLELSIRFYPEQDLNLAIRYQSLAGLFFLSLDLAKAESYYHKALNIYKHTNHWRSHEVYEALNALKELKRRGVDPPVSAQISPEEEFPLQMEFALEALVRLAEFYEKQRNYRDALECYWKALQMVRDAEIETNWIELRVQRVSKRLRQRKAKR